MKKMVIVDECFQCPHSFKFQPDGRLECDKKEKAIPDPYKIPGWCPLKDAPEQADSPDTQYPHKDCFYSGGRGCSNLNLSAKLRR